MKDNRIVSSSYLAATTGCRYFIIGGSFKCPERTVICISSLKKNFINVESIGLNKNGFLYVSIARYRYWCNAVKGLLQLKSSESLNGLWIYDNGIL